MIILYVILAYMAVAAFTIFTVQVALRFIQGGDLYNADKEVSLVIGALWPVGIPATLLFCGAGMFSWGSCTLSEKFYNMVKGIK